MENQTVQVSESNATETSTKVRDVIFISHATPEDNNFAIWLASRLQLLGYKVWIDKSRLLGGEKTWQEIDRVIRNDTIKFLLVYSNNICLPNSPGQLKDGIDKEISLAESVSKELDLKDHIIFLNLDDAKYNLFIGANRFNHIPFAESWAAGLRQLVQKLEKDAVEKMPDGYFDTTFRDWYSESYVAESKITSKKELYYTNWWQIPKLPEKLFLYQFNTNAEADELYKRNNIYPVGKVSNVLSTFDPDFSLEIEKDGLKWNVRPKNVFALSVNDILNGLQSTEFPTATDAENHLKRLLNRIFHEVIKSRGLFWETLASKNLAYFYTPKILPSSKIKFEYPHRKKRKFKTKNLIGRYLTLGQWHFAVSNKTILHPNVCFSLKSHLVFTHDGFKLWEDKAKSHTHRRKKGKNCFNETWRDLLISFLHGLKDDKGKITIRLNSQFTLELDAFTQMYWSDFGYMEPRDKNRQDILDVKDDDEIEENNEPDAA
ncbi:MAG: toll/interleukin-1 receptor domain-containing protein [Candidatus Omnitrophica bacterium]|nr:toll/interleukin-1 receptor domain-containing protein [Candidatus Omnitrophota bacterium]